VPAEAAPFTFGDAGAPPAAAVIPAPEGEPAEVTGEISTGEIVVEEAPEAPPEPPRRASIPPPPPPRGPRRRR
jgi:hypothetical protein